MRQQISAFGSAMAVFLLFATFAGLSFALAVEMQKQGVLPGKASPPPKRIASSLPSVPAASAQSETQPLLERKLRFPVPGFERALRDNFSEQRGKRRHEALDIMAPRGTPVVAVGNGRVAKLFESGAGGITLYQFDPTENFAYYYAHLDRYAPGMAEGAELKRGDLIGYVGSTGNAPPHAPHLHFAIFELGADKRWWKGKAINPYPYLAER